MDDTTHLDEIASILVQAIKRSLEREKSKNIQNRLDSVSVSSVHAENHESGEFQP